MENYLENNTENLFYSYFEEEKMIEIIGMQNSLKQKIIINILIKKLFDNYMKTKEITHVLYVDSDLNFSPTYCNKTINSFMDKRKKDFSKNDFKKTKEYLLSAIYRYKIPTSKEAFELLDKELSLHLDEEKSALKIKTIVFDNLTNVFNSKSTHFNSKSTHFKPGKNYVNEIFQIARRRKMMVIFLSNLKYSKIGSEFYLEPENADILNEFMASIFLAEFYEKSSGSFIMKPLKSRYDEPDYSISLYPNFMIQ